MDPNTPKARAALALNKNYKCLPVGLKSGFGNR